MKNRHKWAITEGKNGLFLRLRAEGCLPPCIGRIFSIGISYHIFTYHVNKHGKQIKMCEVVGKEDFLRMWKNVCDRRNEKLQNLTFEKKYPIYPQKLLYWWRINQMLMLLMCGVMGFWVVSGFPHGIIL